MCIYKLNHKHNHEKLQVNKSKLKIPFFQNLIRKLNLPRKNKTEG